MTRKIVGAALAVAAAGVVAGYVYDWWQECRYELFDPEWTTNYLGQYTVCSCIPGDNPNQLVQDEWCPVHGDPELGSLVVRD